MIAAMAGIVLLYDGGGSHLSAVGTLLTLGSAVSYAIYMVAVNKSRLAKLDTLQLTFYSLLFGLLVFVVQLKGLTLLKPLPPTVWAWGNLLGLSVFPTIVSLLTMTVAIHCIGSVPVSILGALEPVTALLIGAMAFDEHLTTQSFVGVSLVIAAVTALVVAKPLWSVLISVRKHRCRH
jgi:drug/metabolite transporter (DMT)-like permease